MKKAFLSLLAGVVLAPAAFAQKTKLQQILRGPLTERQHAALQSVLQSMPAATAGKTTAQMQRLIGYGINSVTAGGLADSARIIYNSPVRGSNHGVNDLGSYYFSYDPTLEYYPQIENLFDAGPLRIKCDSVVLSDASGIYQTSVLTYNAALQPTSFRSDNQTAGTSNGRDRYTMTYSSGRRTQLLYETDTVTSGSTGPFIPDYRLYTTFGGTPVRALRDSTVPAVNAPFTTDSTRTLYSYTGGNLTTLDFLIEDDTVQRLRMSYDASGRVRIADLYADFGAGLELFLRDSLTYTGSYPFYTGGYFLLNTGFGLELVQAGVYSVNAQGLRDTLRIYDDANMEVGIVAYQYNSYGNPDGYRYYDLLNSSTVPIEIGRYYYELYDPTSIADAPIALQATAYPNPVRNTLALSWQRSEGAVNIQVADAAGRVLERLSAPAASAAYNLDMSRYATGTYFVTLAGGAGAVQHLKVAKQ